MRLLNEYWRHSWRNGYHWRKWIRLPEFKTRLYFLFLIGLILLNVTILRAIELTELFNLCMTIDLGERKLWIQTSCIPGEMMGSSRLFLPQTCYMESIPTWLNQVIGPVRVREVIIIWQKQFITYILLLANSY